MTSSRPLPLLIVRASQRVTLSKPLLACIPHLRHGSPVELVAPPRRGGTWHLDTRPTASRRLSARPGEAARFRSGHTLGPEHFVRPAVLVRKGTKGGALGSAGHQAARTFVLGAELSGHPGYYVLHRHEPTSKRAASPE